MTKHSEIPETANCDNNVLANRLLKFNVWDVDRQQYFHDVLSLEKDKIVQWRTLEKRISNNVIWLQHTGYKDKNGKLIVEGDIVKHKKGTELIDWDSLTFNLMITYTANYNKKCEDWLDKKVFEGIEVIGNIFQNPELLTQTTS